MASWPVTFFNQSQYMIQKSWRIWLDKESNRPRSHVPRASWNCLLVRSTLRCRYFNVCVKVVPVVLSRVSFSCCKTIGFYRRLDPEIFWPLRLLSVPIVQYWACMILINRLVDPALCCNHPTLDFGPVPKCLNLLPTSCFTITCIRTGAFLMSNYFLK